jgi:hypothetical protein
VLRSQGHNDVRQTSVANDAISRQPHSTGWRNDTAAPIAESIAVWGNQN